MLTKAEAFYIESHRDKDPKAVAADLNVTVKKVTDHLKANPAPPPQRPPLVEKISNFAVQNGSVSMTASQSQAGDEFTERLGPQQIIRDRVGKIHKIRPDEPSR